MTQTQSAVIRDGERAKAERTAELAELNAKLSEFRTSLLQFHQENIVTAPFSGTVVYRNPTPALAAKGKVILALAKGPGFLATVQVPTREAAMLEPGQKLRMKLKHSLVSEEISGQLQSVRPVPGYPDRRDLLIECELPREQFAAFSSGSIPVTLQWRPPLYTDRVAQGGTRFFARADDRMAIQLDTGEVHPAREFEFRRTGTGLVEWMVLLSGGSRVVASAGHQARR